MSNGFMQQVPYRPICEVCGQENEEMAAEIRKQKLMRGGGEVMAMVSPLRPANMCDRCRAALVMVVRSVVTDAPAWAPVPEVHAPGG